LAAGAAIGTAIAVPAGSSAPALTWSVLRRTLTHPAVRDALIVSSSFLSAVYAVFTYFRPYFGRAQTGGVAAIVWLFSIYGAVGIAGTLLGGWAIDRFGTRLTLLASICGCGLTFVALPLASQSLIGASLGVALWALTSWGFGPAMNRQLEHVAGEARDVAFALNLTAFNVGIAAGSALGGSVIAVAGIASIPFAAATLCGVAFAVTFLGVRSPIREPRHEAMPRAR
jgi:DHA1 family inner membrane transport protein